jgi:transcriptional antiterminator
MKNGSRMTLQQVMDSGVALLKDPDDFEKQGIISVRSTPEVIRQLAVEFAQMYENGFRQSADDEKIAHQANEIIERGMGEFGQNKFGNVTAHLNPAFLREQGDWFLA